MQALLGIIVAINSLVKKSSNTIKSQGKKLVELFNEKLSNSIEVIKRKINYY